MRLLDGVVMVDAVDVPGQGSYELDPAAGVITFTPVLGFAGVATPVTYRIRDAWNQQDDSTYTPTVAAPAPPNANPLTSSGTGTQSVTVAAPAAGAVTLVDGGVEVTSVTVPEGTYLLDTLTTPATISFVPDAGVTGTATPATYRLIDAYNQTGDSTYTPTVLGTTPPPPNPKNKKLRNSARTNVVARRFTLVRPAYFASESAIVRPVDRRYLRQVGQNVGKVERVICVGYTDDAGSAVYNARLGEQRARAACRALDLPRGVTVVIRTMGERHPVATNTTEDGRARNRRATVTLTY